MAKRKRLTPANPAILGGEGGQSPSPLARSAPIADVARDAASEAAMGEMVETLSKARREGRMILSLPLSEIDVGHLVRDRVTVDAEDMRALKESLRARGQQTPVEVVEIGPGRYGLISGWRRCRALRELRDETGEARFGTVLALLRQPAEASDAYLSMVEENEVRVGLSYYERARIVSKAVEQGVFATKQDALRGLFHSASRAKRSKIGSFLQVVEMLDGALAFPHALGERQGLRLAKALADDDALAGRLRQKLASPLPETAEAEQSAIALILDADQVPASRSEDPAPSSQVPASDLTTPRPPTGAPGPEAKEVELRKGLWRRTDASGRVTVFGPALTPELRDRLDAWLTSER